MAMQAEVPRLKVGDIIQIDGWVMLQGLDAGLYRVRAVTPLHGRMTYSFSRLRGLKPVARHYVSSVDSWLRSSAVGRSAEDLNRITKVETQHAPT